MPHNHDTLNDPAVAPELRLRALESFLIENGHIEPPVLSALISAFGNRIDPDASPAMAIGGRPDELPAQVGAAAMLAIPRDSPGRYSAKTGKGSPLRWRWRWRIAARSPGPNGPRCSARKSRMRTPTATGTTTAAGSPPSSRSLPTRGSLRARARQASLAKRAGVTAYSCDCRRPARISIPATGMSGRRGAGTRRVAVASVCSRACRAEPLC